MQTYNKLAVKICNIILDKDVELEIRNVLYAKIQRFPFKSIMIWYRFRFGTAKGPLKCSLTCTNSYVFYVGQRSC